jgi:hypothetical protein
VSGDVDGIVLRLDAGDAVPEDATLGQLEGIIRRDQSAFLRVGRALLLIRERRLYLQAGHLSFASYLRDNSPIRRSYADKLIKATRFVDRVRTVVPALPTSEGEIRAAAALPEAAWAEVAGEAAAEAERNGEVLSGRHWRAAAARWHARQPPSPAPATVPVPAPAVGAPVVSVRRLVAAAPVALLRAKEAAAELPPKERRELAVWLWGRRRRGRNTEDLERPDLLDWIEQQGHGGL